MFAIASHSPSLPTHSPLGMRVVAKIGRHVSAKISDWRVSMRQRSELSMLNAVELGELSLTEADVNREASKPFWESASLTGR
jgi:uncharacterized protein YjiS (DUF1127 family)